MRNFFNREKTAAFPKEFEDALNSVKVIRQCTEDAVKALEKVLRDPPKNEQHIEQIEAVAKTCEKYTNAFGDGCLTAVLNSTSTVFSIVARKEKYMRKECYDHVLLPLKVWVQDDYPRFMQDIEKTRKLYDQMESAGIKAQNKGTDEKIQKYENAKIEFNKAFEACKAELDRMKKINQHHMSCMKLMSQHHFNFYKAIDGELEKATEAMTRSVDPTVKPTTTIMKSPNTVSKK